MNEFDVVAQIDFDELGDPRQVKFKEVLRRIGEELVDGFAPTTCFVFYEPNGGYYRYDWELETFAYRPASVNKFYMVNTTFPVLVCSHDPETNIWTLRVQSLGDNVNGVQEEEEEEEQQA